MCRDKRYVAITATKISRTYHWYSPILKQQSIYEHKCLENINKLYKHAGKCDDQKQFKDFLDAAMVSTPERLTNNNPTSPRKSTDRLRNLTLPKIGK